MKYLIIVFCSMITMNSCASKKKIVTDTTQLTRVLEVSKSPCFGECPVFTLSVYDNGLAVLDGQDNLKHIGLYHKILDKKVMASLMKTCDEAQLFSLKDSYMRRVMDLPTTSLAYSSDGQTKNISGNMDFPDGFKKVIKEVMDMIDEEDWELKKQYNTK
ncbi:MAG: hypothetical protein KJP00_13115 [Bacteroidia bacterium]|nr:hypothetical protein [Bacteroidia bacterium]